MADKYTSKANPPPPSPKERVANILQCRLGWALAEKVAEALDAAGLPSEDRHEATFILRGHMSPARAEACADDLANHGLVPRASGRIWDAAIRSGGSR